MKKPASTELRIVDQARTMNAFEYDFACGEARLTLHVERAETAPELWRVDASARQRIGEEVCKTTASASTRIEALRAAAAEWRSAQREPSLDWERIETLLQQVHAL
jgi:hypothetical protein